MSRSSLYLLGVLLAATTGFAQDPTDKKGWVKQIEAALEAERDQDAMTYIGRAAKAFPDEAAFKNAAKWFERHGEKRIKDKGYDAGLAVAERAFKVLPTGEQGSIRVWRNSLYRFWSQDLLDKKDFEGSLKVLARGYELYPTDTHVQAAIAYHTQEALKAAEAKSVDAVIELFQTLAKQFPKVDDIARRGQRQAALAVNKLVEEAKFKEAFAMMDRYAPVLTKAEQRAEVGGMIYDGWALHLASKKMWEPALEKFTEGLKAYPSQMRLQRNALAIIEEWAEPAINAKKWDDAIRVYDVGLKYFPNNEYLVTRKQRCEKLKEEKK